MSSSSSQYDPFALLTSTLAFWADVTRTTQTQYVKTLEQMSANLPDMVTWRSVDVPIFSMFPDTPISSDALEERLRESFQIAADINLNTWTHIANIISALPDWAHWPTEVPGRAMTDMFDEVRRTRSTPNQP